MINTKAILSSFKSLYSQKYSLQKDRIERMDTESNIIMCEKWDQPLNQDHSVLIQGLTFLLAQASIAFEPS
jgi:hypothetical protein